MKKQSDEIENAATTPITDIDLSALERKKFRINGDNNRILELNTSDLNILSRLKDAYPQLVDLTNDAIKRWPQDMSELNEESLSTDGSELDDIVEILADIDGKMRKLVDYIFDANASEICVPEGSMYDPVNGMFRFEHIINSLGALYEKDITSEMRQISNRVKKHTDKYTKK